MIIPDDEWNELLDALELWLKGKSISGLKKIARELLTKYRGA